MKHTITTILLLLCGAAFGQQKRTDLTRNLLENAPIKFTSFNCPCKIDTTGGYISIEDTVLHNPICNYELLTKAHLSGVEQNRDTIPFFPAQANRFYRGTGYSRGHCLPFEDLAYSPPTAKASMNLNRNLAPEPQNQNIGTELASENYERKLALQYDSVKVYVGTNGTYGNIHGINIPVYYWKVIIANGVYHFCYWMPTTRE